MSNLYLHGELSGVCAGHGAGLTAGEYPHRPDVRVHHAKGAAQRNPALDQHHALIKKKTKFSSCIRKFRWDRLQSHIWKGFLIYEEMRKYLKGHGNEADFLFFFAEIGLA